MSYPNGVSLAVITAGPVSDFFGGDVGISVTVTPVLGDTSYLTHAATGAALIPDQMTFKAAPGGTLSFSVPHVNQDGWLDDAVCPRKGWSYRVEVTAGYSPSWSQVVAPVVGQDLIDLDLVGTVKTGKPTVGDVPTVGEVPTVVSVVGKTGAITAQDLIDAGVVSVPDWMDITGKPESFPPAAHTHAADDVTSGTLAAARLPAATTTTQGAMLPADKARLDDATSGAAASTLVQRDTFGGFSAKYVWGLDAPGDAGDAVNKKYVDDGLVSKAAAMHTHSWADVSGKPATFPPASHSHPVSDVSGLFTALAGKADNGMDGPTAYRTVDGRLLERTPLHPFHLAAMKSDTESVKVVVLGSSSANGGYPSHPSMQWSHRLAARMGPNPVRRLDDVPTETQPGVWWITGAQGGTTSANYITATRMANIKTLKPAVVIHMVGSNDWSSSVPVATYKSQLKANLQEIAAALPSTVQVLVHQAGRWDVTRPTPWDDYGAAMRELVREDESRRVFVNANATFARAGVPKPNTWGWVQADKIHMGDDGNRAYAKVIGDALGIVGDDFTAPKISDVPLSASASYTTLTTCGTLKIPACPYPRTVKVDGIVFAGVTGGEGEVAVSITGQPVRTLMRVAQGIPRHATPVHNTAFLPAHTPCDVVVEAVPLTGGTIYVSGSSSYSRVTVTEYPI